MVRKTELEPSRAATGRNLERAWIRPDGLRPDEVRADSRFLLAHVPEFDDRCVEISDVIDGERCVRAHKGDGRQVAASSGS
jgi:hypothetical protein